MKVKRMPRANLPCCEVYPARDGWRFRAIARNGEITGQGESYTRRYDCAKAARREHPKLRLVIRPATAKRPARPRSC